MHAPPRLALLAALSLLALFPSLPLGSSVVAGGQDQDELYGLEILPLCPATEQDLVLDLALVPSGGSWIGPLALYRPDQPLLLTKIHATCDVLLRSRDGLWAGRSHLKQHPSPAPLPIRLEPRAILSGVVLDSDNRPMNCLVQAKGRDGSVSTVTTSKDGTFRFAWLPEGKYELISPLSAHGRCRTSAMAIAGQEVHLRLQPQPTQGPSTKITGHVQSHSGDYREDIHVRLIPMDVEAAPTEADVVWHETATQGINGSFEIPATLGAEYIVRVEKNDLLPTVYSHSPFLAPNHAFEILCDDSTPHTDLLVRPIQDGAAEDLQDFEVALSWGPEVIWRSTSNGTCLIQGLPTGVPVSWMVRSPNTAPVYGRRVFALSNAPEELIPQLSAGWGEGLRLALPDGSPAAHVLVYLDGALAGQSDLHGLLTVHSPQVPTTLSLRAEYLRLFGGSGTTRLLSDLTDRDEFGRLLLVLLPRD
jgi:hypothetical protein